MSTRYSRAQLQRDSYPLELRGIAKPLTVSSPLTEVMALVVDTRLPPCVQLMWVLADVLGLFSIIVGPFSGNVGRGGRIFSANLGQKSRCYRVPQFMVVGRYR
jgi:hypothetical protein